MTEVLKFIVKTRYSQVKARCMASWVGILFFGLTSWAALAQEVFTNFVTEATQASLSEALTAAQDNGGYVVFSVDGTITLSNTFAFSGGGFTLDAAGHDVTISGNNAVRIFAVTNAQLTLIGLDLVNGRYGSGAAILNQGGALEIFNCTFADNVATNKNAPTGVTGGVGDLGTNACGGAIYSRGTNATVTIADSIFRGNFAIAGAGGDGGTGFPASVRGGTGGQGGIGGFALGGAICVDAGAIQIVRSTFSDNVCLPGNGGTGGASGPGGATGDSGLGGAGGYGRGGAIYINSGLLEIRESLIVSNLVFGGNSAGIQPAVTGVGQKAYKGGDAVGGGIFSGASATLNMVNCTLFQNISEGGFGGDTTGGRNARAGDGGDAKGGGLFFSGTANLLNCTLAFNRAFGGSNGIAGITSGGTNSDSSLASNNGMRGLPLGGNIYKGGGTGTLANTILTGGGAAKNCVNTIIDGGYNISSDGSCKFAAGSTSFNNLDPKLVLELTEGPDSSYPPALPLMPDSPAINAIPSDAVFPEIDQLGTPRPQGLGVDIGAFELEESALVPVIMVQPKNVTAAGNANVTLSVVAAGQGPLSFQWSRRQIEFTASTNPVVVTNYTITTNYVVVTNIVTFPPVPGQTNSSTITVSTNAVFSTNSSVATNFVSGVNVLADFPIEGATNATFVIKSAQVENSGYYAVVVSSDLGMTTSSNALVQIGGPATLTSQPHDAQALIGTEVSFAVTAWGTAPINYQWYHDTNRLVGATSSILTLRNVQRTNAGVYRVVVQNASRHVVSQGARLDVLAGPRITNAPGNVTAALNSQVILNVGVEGDAPLRYQWNLNGQPIVGATNQAFVIPAAQVTNSGRYNVVVNNDVGSAVSSEAVVSIQGPATITAQPLGTNVALGSNTTFTVTAWGSGPLSYQWMWNSNVVSEATNLLVGATNNTLTLTNVQRANGGIYSVVVSNALGVMTSSNALLTVYAPAAIVDQPLGQTNGVGANVTLSVTAKGDALTYHWFKDGQPIAGAMATNLMIFSAQVPDSGYYSVVVSNLYSSVMSSNALVIINGPLVITSQPQSNQVAFVGTNVSLSVTAWGGAALRYQWFFNSNAIPGQISPTLKFNNVQSSKSGVYYVVVSNGTEQVISSNALLTVVTPASIKAQPQSWTLGVGSSVTLSVNAVGDAPLLFQWTRDGYLIDGATSPTFTINQAQAEDAGNYAVIVSNNYRSVTSSNAVIKVAEPAVITSQPLDTNAVAGTTVSIAVSAEGAPLHYQWYYASNALTSTPFIPLFGANNATNLILAVMPANAGLYKVVVSNVVNAVTSSVATLRVSPVIEPLPQEFVVAAGKTATIKAVVDGSAPMSLQWFRDDLALNKATNTTLTISRAQLTNSGSYVLVATNVCGATTSSITALTVCSSVKITKSPASMNVREGTNITLSVVATGYPIFYQWTFNGNPLEGKTNATLSLPNVTLEDAGKYQVIASNTLSKALSAKATLGVYVPVSITDIIENQTHIAGNKVVLSVETDGSAPISYQWQFNGKNMVGQTRSNLVFNPIKGTQAGAYTVKVKNSLSKVGSSTESATINVTVVPPAPIITSPTNGSLLTTTNIIVSYTIPSTLGVTQLVWTVNGSNSVLTPGKGGSLPLSLQEGTNTVEIVAKAPYGSSASTLATYYVVPSFAGKGTYTGLFYEPNGAQVQSSGFVQLKVEETGVYSGKLLQGTNEYSISGLFDSVSNSATNRQAGSPVAVELAFLADPIAHIEGTVSNGVWTAELSANRVSAPTNLPHVGRFTFEMPGTNVNGLAMGSSVAAVTVDKTGNVTINGSLADGSQFNQSFATLADEWPLYASLYSGRGTIFGWIQFTNAAQNPLAGQLVWIHPSTPGAKLYPNGFTNQPIITSSRYGSTNLVPVLNLTNAVVVMTDGNLAAPLSNSVVLTAKNTFVVTSTNQLTLKLSSTNGVVTGSFFHPVTKTYNTLQGILLQEQNTMKGFFLGTNQTGTILLK